MIEMKFYKEEKLWIADSSYEDYKKLKFVFGTSAVGGPTFWHENGQSTNLPMEMEGELRTVAEHVLEGTPIKIGKMNSAWIREYGPGGFSRCHHHTKKNHGVFTMCIYFDEAEQEHEGDELSPATNRHAPGNLYCVLPRSNQTAICRTFAPAPGRVVIFPATMFHGTVPCRKSRQVLVADFHWYS
tara:strand:- start:187 stop:741 length:555 start_codon:yes stop_codon:yes gene_type:complete